MNAQEIAQRCADLMWAEDKASKGLGMKVESVAPGRAVLSMTVREDMVNGHDICHGGFIFTLADSAFAFACNTYNQRVVAQHCAVTFLRPGKRGMILLAQAQEKQRGGRSGIYDVLVTNDQGDAIAEFRGHSRVVTGTFF
ncbi:MAG: hydroxyphenylacetyl-CoA thioesterase PaaI [Hyphomicrobiales bacterium]|nr:hydroxyphenylacetyl-CoA thioesterase PaaI [Hyphomicrobiales bacterium]